MAQHDGVIDNGSGAVVRADINGLAQAILTLQSGSSAPTTTYPYMWWVDAANGLLKQRNSANSGWIIVARLVGGKFVPVETMGAAVASAAAVDLGAVDGDYVHITGTTTITSFGSTMPQAGPEMTVVFDGALTLTHNAAALILPGGANIATAAGDTAVMRYEGSGNWRCVAYTKANGQALAGAGVISVDTTLTVGSGKNHASLTAAMAYLADYRIKPGVLVTIEVYGHVTEPGVVIWRHPDSSSILVKGGTASTTTNITGTYPAGGAGGSTAYTLVLTVASVAGVSVGDQIGVACTSGSNNAKGWALNAGLWDVTAVDAGNNSISYTNTAWPAVNDDWSYVNGGHVRVYKNSLRGANGALAVNVSNGATLRLTDLAVVATGTASTIQASNASRLLGDNIGLRCHHNGYQTIYATDNSFVQVSNNLYSTGALWAYRNASMNLGYVFNGSGGTAIYAHSGGSITISNLYMGGANSYALCAQFGGQIHVTGSHYIHFCGGGQNVMLQCQDDGWLYLYSGSYVGASLTYGIVCQIQGRADLISPYMTGFTTGYYCYGPATLRVGGSPTGTVSTNITINSLAAGGAYIAWGY